MRHNSRKREREERKQVDRRHRSPALVTTSNGFLFSKKNISFSFSFSSEKKKRRTCLMCLCFSFSLPLSFRRENLRTRTRTYIHSSNTTEEKNIHTHLKTRSKSLFVVVFSSLFDDDIEKKGLTSLPICSGEFRCRSKSFSRKAPQYFHRSLKKWVEKKFKSQKLPMNEIDK